MDPRYYRLAPELRRSAVYAMAGFALISGVTYWVGHVFLERDLSATIFVCSGFGAVSLAMIVPLRWALYVDGSGVARRWLVGWDLWSWSDFASGRIHKRHAFTFTDPQSSWWSGYLTLDLVADAERMDLIKVINQYYRLPEAPALPESLQVHYGFRRSIQLSRQEVRLTVSGETMSFAWRNVLRLRITRVDPVRRDFACLTLFLPGHDVELRWHNSSPTWSGASAEEVNEFLLTHVPADRIDLEITGERPVQREDVQKELDLMRTKERQLRVCLVVFGLLFVALLIGVAIDEGPIRAFAMGGLYLLFVPVCWLVLRECRKKVKRLEVWLMEIEASGTPASKSKW